jgi:hypothetical protein
MNKMKLTLTIILAAVGCVMLPSPVTAARANPGPPFVGLWTRTVTDPNDPSIILSLGFQQYHNDYTEMINDTLPPTAGNVCLGVWTQVGARTFKLEHTAWLFDSGGDVIGTFRLRETVAVDPSGESYNGTNTVAVCDTNVENCVDVATGDVHGARRHVGF